ncbi:MAG TPA: tetratricopeptide repeat protein [Burkholderiaceae bacterium]|nr:tetratricopeptide repeat protein [Burkholderiaceae bacterium]
MRPSVFILICLALALAGAARAQQAPNVAPRIDERVAQIAQTAPGAPWAFIGYAIAPPASANWFVTDGTPRGGTMGRQLSATEPHTAVLVLSSELIGTAIESDAKLLEFARARHAKIGERWSVERHDETIVRHAGTRCARHLIEAREPEDRSPRKDTDTLNARRTSLHVIGLACMHPNDATFLIEVGVSERSRETAMTPEIRKEAEAVIASLAFHRYSEDALQKSAEAARAGGLAAAEAVLKPYLDAHAAWAGYFMAQILERAAPPPGNVGARLRALLEPAAERGLADAQWALGRLYLRGAPGLDKDPVRAEMLLRRAAERGNPGAAFQLGLSQLSGADGLASNSREAALWIQRAAFRGQKEAQEMVREARNPGTAATKR